MLPTPRGRQTSHGGRASHARLLQDRVQMLFAGTGTALSIVLVAALLFVAIHMDSHVDIRLTLGWLSVTGLVLLLRLGVLFAWRRRENDRHPERWLMRYRIGALLTGACWGVAGIAFFATDHSMQQSFTVLVIAGVAAGALGVQAADYPTYRGYVGLSLLPLALLALLSPGDDSQTTIGLLVVLLTVFLLRSGRHTAQSVTDSLQLRYENADLLRELEQEKNHAIHEAEAMMHTVLSSAPIALWATDRRGNVTYMQSERLSRQAQFTMPAIGDNLEAFFTGVPQLVRDTRRVLRGEALVSEVDFNDFSYEIHFSPLLGPDGEQRGAMGVAIDITDRKRHEQQLLHRANYDELTGLANRTLATESIKQAFARARRSKTSVGICFLDLDNFKSINDTLGHRAGDQLLRQAAQRLKQCVRESDLAARISGDEFLVVAENLNHPDDAETLAHKIVSKFHQPFVLNGRQLFATTSIGIALYPRDGNDVDYLVQCADTAMYAAKESGKNSYRFFTADMHNRAMRHLTIETEIRHALQRDELHLYYQPKIDIQQGSICGAEVLLRWDSRELGRVSPDEFIPVAEMAGLMPQIGDWVLRNACREAAQWQDLGLGPIGIAINISPQQFRKTDLLANVTEALVESGLPSSVVELEITESLLVQDAPSVVRTFQSLNEMGLTLALDDFGTGYSSLSYLRRFPLQVLKIDKAFVQDLGQDRDSESLVQAIIAMARSLRMKIVAEGAETEEQAAFLREHGVDLVQGYLYSAPVPAQQFRELLLDPSRCGLQPPACAKQEGSPALSSG